MAEPNSEDLENRGATVSVVIPSYRSRHLGKVLKALVPLGAHEIIVVDSSPDPPELPIGGSAQLIHVEHQCPPSEARNIGARKAKGDLLLFVDADVVLEASAIEFVHRFACEPGSELVSGVYDPAEPAG